jgi:hypothetical protein
LKNKYKIVVISVLIFFFRIVDLFTTDLAIIDFKEQEQNMFVDFFNLDMTTFFMLEIIFGFMFIMLYVISLKSSNDFVIRTNDFIAYIKIFFYKKEDLTTNDFLFRFSFKRMVVLYGSVIPSFVITTSILFSLNNYWVYFNINSDVAFKYYMLFDAYCFFDILIFIFPPVFLMTLFYRKLVENFKINMKI